MKRRQLLTYTALGTTGTAVLGACGAASTPEAASGTASSALPTVEWRMATSWPQSLDTIFGGAQRVCDRVAALSGGKFTIEPAAAGEIVPGLEVWMPFKRGQCSAATPPATTTWAKIPLWPLAPRCPLG
jgi:TRAP-type mannitol/chloroaromatic compound transport system substrate-binding protein